jgi:hypothetical protein
MPRPTPDESKPNSCRPRKAKNASHQRVGVLAFAERLAKDKRATLPSGYDKDFDICRRFLDQHAGR